MNLEMDSDSQIFLRFGEHIGEFQRLNNQLLLAFVNLFVPGSLERR